jgi:two-component system sensor histidine kinase KdpD
MRRGARLARRRGGSCLVVTVQSGTRLVEETDRLRALADQLGCAFAVLGGRDVAGAVIQAAHDFGAEHVVVGEVTTEGRLSRLRPTIVDRIIDSLPDSAIHVISLVGHQIDQQEGAVAPLKEQRPDPMALLRKVSSDNRRHALFRAYLGYAPGCGATTVMLDEARRRTARGTDAVVAAYHVHGEPQRELAGLDVLGGVHSESNERVLDLDEVLARNPQVVCLDDLAEPDREGRARLEAVPMLLDAGITVLATLHLLSIRSAAEAASSLIDRSTAGLLLDDEFLSVIDELEVVDIPPADLLQRIAEHEILSPAQRALAMQQELRPRVLGMLRETALRMCADHVDRQFVEDLRRTDGMSPGEVRGRIVLGLPVLPGLEKRIPATAQYALEQDATFTVVSVRRPGLSEEEKKLLGAYAALTHQMHGEFVRLEDRLVAPALAQFTQRSLATELILGHRRLSRWRPWDTTGELIRLLEGVDIHILPRRA